MKAEACAERFVQCHYRFHGFPSAITSDRGSNWVGDFWRHLCKLVGIGQRPSTGFHPETDGSTERAVIAYLRAFISYSQLTHGYHIEPIPQVSPLTRSRSFCSKNQRRYGVRAAWQASTASAQQIMEDSANHSRQAAELFKENDKVWLNLKNIDTPQLSKKLSWVNANNKYVHSHQSVIGNGRCSVSHTALQAICARNRFFSGWPK
jgi:hypothetical protein